MFCREHVAQLRRRYTEFQAAGAQVIVVGMGTPGQTRVFMETQELPFAVLSDPIRRSHRAYGVMRGSLRQLSFHPQVWLHGAQAVLDGNLQGRTMGDPAQLSATFIVDRQGIIRLAERAELSSDYTAIDTLLAALAALPPPVTPLH